MPEDKLLVYFFADLLRDAEGLQGKVISDPQGAMQDYGLSRRQISVLNRLKVNTKTLKSSQAAIAALSDSMIEELEKLCRPIIKKNPNM
jgi:hypothetical protein